MNSQVIRARERVPTGRRGRPSKSMIAAALERPFCAYLHKICLNNRLEGHKYCIDHIMNDKTAPYRQCTYVHSVTGRRCNRAAHKVDRRASPLCQYHRALRVNAPPLPSLPIEELTNSKDDSTSSQLFEDLAHHLMQKDPSQPRPQGKNTFWSARADGSAVPSAKLNKALAKYQLQRLQTSEIKPVEMPTMEEIAARHNNADSDTESVDNNLDMFKHASVFTEEELTRTLRDKMIKLRRLYIEQYGHIQYILKEKRLKYIQAQRNEDETYGEFYSFRNNRQSPDYSRLRAMLRYHKTFGPESLLQEQAKRRKLSRPPTVGPHPHPNAQRNPPQVKVEVKSEQPATAATPTLTATTTITTSTVAGNATTTTTTTSTSTSTTPAPPALPTTSTTASTSLYMSLQNPENVCVFSKTPHGCDKPTIPLSPYCRQHILYDTKQVLFRPCAGGIPPCLTPVVSFTRKNKCWLHTATK